MCKDTIILKNLYTTQDLEILIATMHQNNFDFLVTMFPYTSFSNYNLVIVNQTDSSNLLVSDYKNIKVINSFTKGLSKSRNLAIKNATKAILLITDDDVIFTKDFDTHIVQAFSNYTTHDILKFQFWQGDKLARNYSKKVLLQLHWFEILNAASIEMAFKRESIADVVFFDENFGLGSIIPLGEEAVFLSDAKKKNKKMGFIPEVIAIHNTNTTTQRLSNETKYFNESAVFYRIFKEKYLFWVFLKLFFDLKQQNISFLHIKKLITIAIKGKKKYEKHKRLCTTAHT